MNQSPKEQDAVREYLLGTLNDEAEMRRIEEKLMLDDAFNEQLSIAEDELMDEYLDGSLSAAERERFLQFFLISPERKEKLRFISDLRKYAGSDADTVQEVKKSPEEKKPFFNWRGLFAQPAFRFAALALIVCGLAFAVWRVAIYESDVDKGLADLRIAYRGQRPFESRTTVNFGYAPHSDLRSNATPAVSDDTARDNAETHLRNAATKNPTDAEAHHALGLFYLTGKDFQKASAAFDRALKLAPANARLHSDVGALYLEKAKLAGDESGDEFLANVELSLQHLNRALELDENLLEALFNKAVLLQRTRKQNLALEAWQKYLEKDSHSEWANEARENIREIESKKSQNLSAEQLEKAFLDAFRRQNEAEARQLISQNREIIVEKYLPQRLAMSLAEASGNEKAEYLQALLYAGELEKKHIKDSFSADIGVFYANVSEANLELLKKAQAAVKNGYKLCLKGEAKSALTEFELARRMFLEAGNVWEAKLSEFVIVYCLIKTHQFEASLRQAEEIISFCEQRDYKWLLSNTLVWFAVGQRKTGQRPKAKLSYQKSLALAEEIGDSFLLQSVNLELAKLNKFVSQDKTALRYLQTVFKNSDVPGASLRQKWRNYSDGTEILAKVKYYNLAQAAAMENILSAPELKDSLMLIYSQQDVGIVYARAGNHDEARNWLGLAKKSAEAFVNEEERQELLGKTALELGHLERDLGNYSQAVAFYSEALSYDEKSKYYLYEIQKSHLLASLSLPNNEAEIEKRLDETLQMVEKYREQILEEQESNSFFNSEQTIYDIAVAQDYKRGNRERAYNHLETSSSRSLLTWLKKGVEVKEEKKQIEITFKETTAPLPLAEIRAEMPEQAQILQYAVLENKVLIWLISKDNFKAEESEIKAEELNKKVSAYTRLVSSQDNQKQEEAKAIARELYDLLISPVVAHLDPSRQISVIPHKILFNLPFAALTAPDGKPFLKQFRFSYAPSANVFLLCTKNAQQKSTATNEFLLSVGNPIFDHDEFKNLPYLPHAEEEAKEIASFYTERQILPGKEATKAALQNYLDDAAIIHFAGHYLVKQGEPLYSGLVLTQPRKGGNPEDSLLTNAELIRRELPRAKVVVLSACQTGVEQYYDGEGLVGLSRTFLAAGAPLVVASQWQVDSKITAKLMKKFHSFRREHKLSTAEALRRAQLEMMESGEGQSRQPFFWAAFAVYGGYAEF